MALSMLIGQSTRGRGRRALVVKRLLVVVILWQAMSASSHGIMRPEELTAGAAHTVVSEPSNGLRQPEIELTTEHRLLIFKKMLPE